MRKLSLLVALAAAACSSSSGPGKLEPTTALFAVDTYVDYLANESSSEAFNMEQALADMTGVTTTSIYDTDAFDEVVASNNVLVIPEQENGDLATDIPAPSQKTVRDLVKTRGGTLIVCAPDAGATDLLNLIFGYSLDYLDDPTGTIALTSDAAGTMFEAGASTLDENDATSVVQASTLPAGAKIIYADDNGDAAVAVIHTGYGNIILLGWDWWNAAPYGTQDGGWGDVLEAAVLFNAPAP